MPKGKKIHKIPVAGGGIYQAAQILGKFPPKEREALLAIMMKSDPALAELLKQNLVTFEDLRYLTTKMLQELLREIDLHDLALSLRIGSVELREHILKNVSTMLRNDILDVLNGPPQSVNSVQEAMTRIMDVVKKKIDKGELVLSKDGSEEYV